MTFAECEIVAQAGARLREIAERLTIPAAALVPRAASPYVDAMDSAALNISEIYGLLSSLPLENEA